MSALRVRVLIPAHNEQARIGRLLDSVANGLAAAERRGAVWRSETVVVLDRCVDDTESIARSQRALVLHCPSPFGKVEALRVGLTPAVDVHVCVDADVVLGRNTLFDLVEALQQDPSVHATCPPLAPEPLFGPKTPLAWALYRYNAARGFSSERLWLSGRCYAVRHVSFPSDLQADDIWLSRALSAHSPGAIKHVDTDPVCYRAPSTIQGMSRTYRRLKRELARVDERFPELPSPGRDRKVDSLHSVGDRLAYAIFQAALALCRVHAVYRELLQPWRGELEEPWPVVRESKR